VRSLSNEEIIRRLDDFELDIGLTYLEDQKLERFRVLPLYRERYVLLARDAASLNNRESISWRDAAALPLCLLTRNMQNRRIMGPSINPIFLQRLRQEGAMSGFGLDWDCGLSGMFWRFCVQVSDFWLSSGDCSSCGCKCGVGAAREEDKT
jgi:DNA-binding transcriptional LysR family regulator